MTRRLILMRHAKSSWKHNLPDHDRPLNARGRRSALALGDWLRAKGWLPDEVLSSSSRRTQETFEGLKFAVTPTYLTALYHAEPEEILQTLCGASGQTVLLLGHNPGIGAFAQNIVAQAPNDPRFEDYPTGATLLATFELETWAALTWGAGQPNGFVKPRVLLDKNSCDRPKT